MLSTDNTERPLRIVTAASLFDGHDAAINVMRRLIQAQGVEVIHLGHNRSVDEVVRAAIQEDADAIAVSSYQGGHMEYFRYMLQLLRESGAEHIKVFGGGGGTITLEEIAELESEGVVRIYHPAHGIELGLVGMIEDLVDLAGRGRERGRVNVDMPEQPAMDDEVDVAQMISAIENGAIGKVDLSRLKKEWLSSAEGTPVVGITGTGGAGKSSLVDELLDRFLQHQPEMRIAVLAVDPTRRRTGGALLGDRIRMNSLASKNIYMRSMATRRQHLATSKMLGDVTLFLRSLGYDLVLLETAGIGQSDSEIVDLVDFSLYIMTSDFGAASQLEKIDMIDYADMVILNKYDKRGAVDALRDIRKQWQRNHNAFTVSPDQIPVYPTIASQFNDPGINRAFSNLCRLLVEKLDLDNTFVSSAPESGSRSESSSELEAEPKSVALIPANRIRYLAEISEQGREIKARNAQQVELASVAYQSYQVLKSLADQALPEPMRFYPDKHLSADQVDPTLLKLRQRYQDAMAGLNADSVSLLKSWPDRKSGVEQAQYAYSIRGKEVSGDNYIETLSHLMVPKVAAPQYNEWGQQLAFLLAENLPGSYPYT
ncbi:MAG TPA: methylmalonyl-CoA mutase, partial [Porticoccus sp.]|nr:methylmalonyl-CoA mutase [Porticoccus sp.]